MSSVVIVFRNAILHDQNDGAIIPCMDFEFADDDLGRVYTEPKLTGGYGQAIVKAFRKRMQTIGAALDERDFYALKSLHFEKLEGRENQCSMRLNKQWRLIIELVGEGERKRVRVIRIEDYH